MIESLAEKGKYRIMENKMTLPRALTACQEFSTMEKSVPTKLKYLSKGYRSVVEDYYDLETYALDDYLSYLDKERLAAQSDPEDRAKLDDKATFYEIIEDVRGLEVPDYIVTDTFRDDRTSSFVYKKLMSGQKLIVKPVDGSGGQGVQILNDVDDAVPDEPSGRVIISDYLDTPSWQYFSYGPGKTRLLTVQSPYGHWYPIIGHQHLVTEESYPVDACAQGGMAVGIGQDSCLKEGIYKKKYDPEVKRRKVIYHPEKGEVKFTGRAVPNLTRATEAITRASDNFPSMRLIGWDLMLYDHGVYVLEANAFPGITLTQSHNPLKKNDRRKEIFKVEV